MIVGEATRLGALASVALPVLAGTALGARSALTPGFALPLLGLSVFVWAVGLSEIVPTAGALTLARTAAWFGLLAPIAITEANTRTSISSGAVPRLALAQGAITCL